MGRSLTVLLFVWMFGILNAADVDSLRTVLPTTSGRAEVDVLDNLANAFKGVSVDSVSHYAQQALEKARKLNYTQGQAAAHASLAYVATYRRNKAEAEKQIKTALTLDSMAADPDGEARDLLFAGNTYMEFGDFEPAARFYIRALKYFEDVQDLFYLAKIHSHLGIIYGSLDDYETSMSYFQKGLDCYRQDKDTLGQGMALMNMGYVNVKAKRYVQALSFLKKAEPIFLANSYNTSLSNLYTSMGQCHAALGGYDQALKQYERSFYYMETSQSRHGQVGLLNNLAGLYLKKHQMSKAREALNRAWKLGRELTEPVNQMKTLELYYKYWVQRGNAPKALASFDRFLAVKDSVAGEERHESITLIKTQYETEKKDLENARLSVELSVLEKQKQIQWLIIGAGAFALLLAMAVIRTMKYRNLALAQNNTLLEKEKTLALEEIQHKNRLLATKALHLENKNRQLAGLKAGLKRLNVYPEDQSDQKALIRQIDADASLDASWDQFKHHFEEVHPGFFVRLTDRYPRLTSNELRLSAYLMIGLSSKEIASIQGISPESVERSRNRLRHKIDLPSHISFHEFFYSFTPEFAS